MIRAAERYFANKFERGLRGTLNGSLIERIEAGNREVARGISTRDYVFLTRAGHKYGARVYMPRNMNTGVPEVIPTAWWTGLDGHNDITARAIADRGVSVIVVGGEGSGHGLMDCGGRYSGISVANSAAAVLRFAQHVATTEYGVDMDHARRLLAAESRGAMVGIGALALCGNFDSFEQSIVYSDLTAPCFPRMPQLGDFVDLAAHPIREASTLMGLAYELGVEVLHYPATVDLHPASITHQLSMIWPLVNADVGRLAAKLPKDTVAHMTAFSHDAWSMLEIWREIFTDHKHIRITELEGTHLTLADPETKKIVIARMIAVLEQLAESAEMIDGEAVRVRSHELVDA